MDIDFLALAALEGQTVPASLKQGLVTLGEQVNASFAALEQAAPHLKTNQALRTGRIRKTVEHAIPHTRCFYDAVMVAQKLLNARQQAVEGQQAGLRQSIAEYIPNHSTDLQKELLEATLAGNAKAIDKAAEGLQHLNQRNADKGEIESKRQALQAVLDLLDRAREVIYTIKRIISPTLWINQAETLKADYLKQREQIADFIALHHQIRACERMAGPVKPARYQSPLPDTEAQFAFDEYQREQALTVLRPLVVPE